MSNPVGRRIWAVFGCWAALTLILLASGAGRRQKVWANPALRWDAGTAYSAPESDYGVKSSGPYLDLPPGEYRLKWQIEGDGVNRIRLSSSNGARIEPEALTVDPARWEDEASFRLLDAAHSFSIGVEFAAGTQMTYYSLRLYSPFYADGTILLSLLLLAAAALCALRLSGVMAGERLGTVAVLLAAALLSAAPSLSADTTGGWDVQFHAARLANLADALRAGQLPARLGGFSYNGYGAVTSVFYPDLFLYPWALMLLAGASMSFALNSLIAAAALGAAFCCYRAARSLGGGRDGAAACAVLYTLSAYRISDAYGGSMLQGELIAMVFLPLFVAELWHVLAGEEKRWPGLALAAAAVFHAHMLTTLLCLFMAVCFFLAALPRLARERKRLAGLAKACTFAVLLCLHRLVPLAAMVRAGVNTVNMQFGFAESALSPSQLLAPDGLLGFGLILGAALALTGAACDGKARLFLAAGGAACLLSTGLFPWSHAVKLTGGAVCVLQFPWRFLLLAAALLSLAGGRGFSGHFPGRAAAVSLIVCLLAAAPVLRDQSGGKRGVPFGEGANPYMVYPEYQIEGTDVADTRSRKPVLSGSAVLSAYDKDGTKVRASVRAPQGGAVTLPVFAFEGYEARLSGKSERLAVGRGNNNRLTVFLPEGAEGELTVRYVQPVLWRICDAVSLLALALLAAVWLRGGKEGADAA